MGWTYRAREAGQSVADLFDELCTFESSGYRSKLLDCATVSLNTAYAAVERTTVATGEREVYALVCQLDLRGDPDERYNFGYKGVEETGGPCEDECPERILKLLTPTENPTANRWRERCWERVRRRKERPALKTGKYLVLDTPLEFADGQRRRIFYIKDARRRVFLATPGGRLRYRLPSNERLAGYGYRVLDGPEEAGREENPKTDGPHGPEQGSKEQESRRGEDLLFQLGL